MDVPAVGLGTLGLKESADAAVGKALEVGCRLIDTGEHYGNLELVGAALKRSEVTPFLVLKLSGMPSGEYESVRGRLKVMLGKLGVERADLCLIHWPGLCSWDPADMGPLASPTDFQGQASTWDEFCENIGPAWANMTKLAEEGFVSSIGTSNFYPHHLDELAKRCGGAAPFANEIFIDSINQEIEFVADMQKRGIKVLAYRPVAYKPLPDPVKKLAERFGDGVSPQCVVLAWLLRRGVWPLVKCRGDHIDENLVRSMEIKDKLSDADLEEFKAMELGLRVSPEWFAKIWKTHNQASAVSEEDVQMLVGMGVEEAKARAALEKCGGNLDAAMDAAFAD